MSIPLAEALQQVELEDGRTYHCRVNGHLIELRVLGPVTDPSPPGIPESDIMMDAWTALPAPPAAGCTYSKLGKPRPPDVPVIPRDEVDS